MYDYFNPIVTDTTWRNFDVAGIRLLRRIALRLLEIYASCETLLWCVTNKEYIVKKE
jgi:hypothetical protein